MTEQQAIQKEITKSNERWVRINKPDCDITVSSPYKNDKMIDLIKQAVKMAMKHTKKENKKPGYLG